MDPKQYYCRLLMLGLLLTLIARPASAQKGFPGVIQRMQIGYSFTKGWAQYESKDAAVDPLTGKTFTNTNKTDVTSKLGWGGVFGTTVPLKKLGRKSILGLGVDYMYNVYVWDYKTPTFNGYTRDSSGAITGLSYTNDDLGFDGASVQLALPISADFKFGCDALTDKSIRFCGTIGAGVFPSMAATVDASNAGFGFGAAPFIKAEFGVMGGICFKIRALYSFGSIPYYTEGNSINNMANFSSTSSLTGKSSLTFSLLFMPFAWKWNTSGWWNSY